MPRRSVRRASTRLRKSCTRYAANAGRLFNLSESLRSREKTREAAKAAVLARNKAKAPGGEYCYKDKQCISKWCEPLPRSICIDPVPGYKNARKMDRFSRPNGAFCFGNYDCISNNCIKDPVRENNYCGGAYPTPEEQKRLIKVHGL